MRKIILGLGVLFSNIVLGEVKRVDFGVMGGIFSQNFSEETWGNEIWKSLIGLIEYRIPNSSFSIRGNIGAGVYQRQDPIKTSKVDLQLEVGPKYLWRIASADVGVYGGEPVSQFGISNGIRLGLHHYTKEERHSRDSLYKNSEIGLGLHLWCGVEYLISSYILFAEIGGGRILRGNFFQEEHRWTQLALLCGVRF